MLFRGVESTRCWGTEEVVETSSMDATRARWRVDSGSSNMLEL